MTGRLLPATGPVRAVRGAMLAGMAACTPAQPEPGPSAWAGNVERSMARLRSGRLHLTQACSPLGQVRAMAWLLGIEPAYAAVTCSRLATGAARCGSRGAALGWLVRAGLPLADASHAAALVWPAPEATAGGAASGRVPGRAPVSE
jgi:hypothetical protein